MLCSSVTSIDKDRHGIGLPSRYESHIFSNRKWLSYTSSLKVAQVDRLCNYIRHQSHELSIASSLFSSRLAIERVVGRIEKSQLRKFV